MGAEKDITVNINDWLNQRQQVFNPNDGWRQSSGVVPNEMTPDELIAEADKRQVAWLESERMRMLEEKLEKNSVECSECGDTERPYLNDYICHRCRDKLDS